MNIPIYLFTGFLEAGNTKFIQETLEDKRFNSGERTVLLLCEEGIEEYDLSKFSGENVFLELLDDEAELTAEYLSSIIKKHNAERLIVEFNGMWQIDTFYNNVPAN